MIARGFTTKSIITRGYGGVTGTLIKVWQNSIRFTVHLVRKIRV